MNRTRTLAERDFNWLFLIIIIIFYFGFTRRGILLGNTVDILCVPSFFFSPNRLYKYEFSIIDRRVSDENTFHLLFNFISYFESNRVKTLRAVNILNLNY